MNLSAEYINEMRMILIPALKETLYMSFLSSLFAIILGLFMGIALYISEDDCLAPNTTVSGILGTIINIGRSIPFVIIIIAVFPLSKIIVGKGIGTTAAIVPLTIAAAPFAARIIESAFKEIDKGIVEAARSMGASVWQIVTKVLLPEASQSIATGITIIIINVIGYSAMAGTIGGGGLGDVAIRYGHQRYRTDLLIYTIIILILLVQIIQFIGNYFSKILDGKNGTRKSFIKKRRN